MEGINEKNRQGINTPKHLAMKRVIEGENDVCYVLQEKCKGKNCASLAEYGAPLEKILKELEYVNKIQGNKLDEMDLTILVNNASNLNMYLIEKLAHKVKSIKIVSKTIYKFKKLEEKLYNDYGIALQFSNSYRKSLLKSKIIINLDFSQTDIDEYNIDNSAMLINCSCNNIKIKSKLFNGIVANSYKLKIKNGFILNEFDDLLIYESKILSKNNIGEIFKYIEECKVSINGFVGNNGTITKKELKILFSKK